MKPSAEIMAPVGSWEALRAACQAGADSVYFGLEALNMRAHAAHNFTLDELPKVVHFCKSKGIKAYVTLNSLIYDADLPLVQRSCAAIKRAGADAVIASDLSVLLAAKKLLLPVHISTQLNVCNLPSVRFFSQFADVIVLARELSLEQIRTIHTAILEEGIRGPSAQPLKLELFVHGALCVAISGKCHMSLAAHNEPANRGRCTQVCRRAYRVIDDQTGTELLLDHRYVMSPKDLCTLPFLDQILDAGIRVLKIEGRGRSADYVYTTVSVYREARDAIYAKTFTEEKKQEWQKRLSSVYNRGFWEGGYYLGKPLNEWSKSSGSQATQTKTYVGRVTRYFPKLGVAEVILESGPLKKGDPFLILGPKTGLLSHRVESLHAEGPIERAEKGMCVALEVPGKVRKDDKLFLIEERSP